MNTARRFSNFLEVTSSIKDVQEAYRREVYAARAVTVPKRILVGDPDDSTECVEGVALMFNDKSTYIHFEGECIILDSNDENDLITLQEILNESKRTA